MRFAPKLTLVAAIAGLAILGACSKSSEGPQPFDAGTPSERELSYIPNRPLEMPSRLSLPEPGGVSRAAGAAVGNAQTLAEAESALR